MFKPFLTNRDNLENARAAPGMLLHFLAKKEDTNGAFALIEARARQGMEPGPHAHSHEDESFYLLNGRMWFKIGEEEFEANPGDFVFMPRGVVHQMKLLTETIHVLIVIAPAGFEHYFWQLSQPAESMDIPPLSSEPPTPEMMEMVAKLNETYGLSSGV
ncbi:MAG: cupin domain-containing protein [Candidatus Promineifilaceae bacterium]